jgi:hypothetical protein
MSINQLLRSKEENVRRLARYLGNPRADTQEFARLCRNVVQQISWLEDADAAVASMTRE